MGSESVLTGINLIIGNMIKTLFFLSVTLFFTLTAKGQNLFLIGDKSYPCSETYTLKSNSDEYYINDLNVVFAKDGQTALFGVKTKTVDVLIRGELMIYLDDGTVITLTDQENHDYVDKIASAVYYLTNEDLSKMKKSNINTIRYTLLDEDDWQPVTGGNFSASNKEHNRTDFPAIVSGFFEK